MMSAMLGALRHIIKIYIFITQSPFSLLSSKWLLHLVVFHSMCVLPCEVVKCIILSHDFGFFYTVSAQKSEREGVKGRRFGRILSRKFLISSPDFFFPSLLVCVYVCDLWWKTSSCLIFSLYHCVRCLFSSEKRRH